MPTPMPIGAGRCVTNVAAVADLRCECASVPRGAEQTWFRKPPVASSNLAVDSEIEGASHLTAMILCGDR
jgi:hypothetical protein